MRKVGTAAGAPADFVAVGLGSVRLAGTRPVDALDSVLFAGSGERIEITHRSNSRANYAQGSLRAVRFLATRATGLYGMDDVLGLV